MVPQAAFRLLAELEAHNNKAWFDAHRDEIRIQVQEPFQAMLEAVTDRLSETPLPWRGGKATMFRMHRDVRFSNDKAPYKTNVAGLLTPSGTKAEDEGLAYVHLAPKDSFAACGFYRMAPPALTALRQKIVHQPDAFALVQQGLAAAGLALWDEGSLKTMPRGYTAHADAPYADALRLKSFVVRIELGQRDWTRGGVVDKVSGLVLNCAGLLRFATA